MYLLSLNHLLPFIFARGGGGGSGGRGGGGGGIIAIGYLPMHFLGAWLRKKQQKHPLQFKVLQMGAWMIAVFYCVLLIVTLRGIGFIAAIGAPFGMGAGLYNWFSKLKQNKQTKASLAIAATKDSVWGEAALMSRASEVFGRFQSDWSNNDAEAMKAYMTPRYQYQNALMVSALQLAGRRNVVDSPVITQSVVVNLYDSNNDDEDTVVVGISATANDQLLEIQSNTVLFTDSSPFTEFWRFNRMGDTWLLDGIQQATASTWRDNPGLESFAAQNGYFYSQDWGWLLLPRHGQIFGDAKFGTSDVNNHVIGMYDQRLLVQLYTYTPKPSSAGKSYLIAQANLPKTYGDIVVRRRGGFHPFDRKGLREVSTEWPDFNKKYQVLATNPEQATSLELLNPKYMEQLEAAPFEVNIEVIDDVVYLYADEGAIVDPGHYATLLGLLHAAFQEMRL